MKSTAVRLSICLPICPSVRPSVHGRRNWVSAATKSAAVRNPYSKSETLSISCRVAWTSKRVNKYSRQVVRIPRKTKHAQCMQAPNPLLDRRASACSRRHCLRLPVSDDPTFVPTSTSSMTVASVTGVLDVRT